MLQTFDNLQPTIYLPALPSDVVKFYTNFNKKLYGKYFTTIRLPSSKYAVGNTYEIHLQDSFITRARLHSKKHLAFDALPEYTAMLDTGCTLQQTKDLLIGMHTLPVLQANGIDVIMFENLEYGY